MKRKAIIFTILITVMAVIPVAVNFSVFSDFFNFSVSEAVNTSVIQNIAESEFTMQDSLTFTDLSSGNEFTRSAKSIIYSLVGASVDENFSEDEVKSLAIAYHTQLCFDGENIAVDTKDKSFFLSENELKTKFGDRYTSFCSYCDNVYKNLIICEKLPANLNISYSDGECTDNENISPKANPYNSLSEDYITELSFDKDTFCSTLKSINANTDTSTAPQQAIGDINYNDNGDVENIVIFGADFSGSDITKAFNLPYKRFTLIYALDEFQFTVMKCDVSNALTPEAAKKMAEQGNTYSEILNYYYSDLV